MASRVVNVTLPEELLQEADKLAQAQRCSRSELFREALRLYLQERALGRKSSAPLLARLARLTTKRPNVSAKDINGLLYGPSRDHGPRHRA